MFSLFCSHDFTPLRHPTADDRKRLGIDISTHLPACMLVAFCGGCGKSKTEYRHVYGAPFEKDYWLECGEKDHHTVRRCAYCPSFVRV